MIRLLKYLEVNYEGTPFTYFNPNINLGLYPHQVIYFYGRQGCKVIQTAAGELW